MSEGAGNPVVFDATVLSNFASTDAVDWLVDHVARPLTSRAVYRELEAGIETGHDFLLPSVEAIERGRIDVCVADEGSSESRPPANLAALDRGERAVIAVARSISATVGTDDACARAIAVEQDLRVTGSIGLLVRGVERDDLGLETADRWLDHWIEHYHYYAPVESVGDVLSDR